MKKVQL